MFRGRWLIIVAGLLLAIGGLMPATVEAYNGGQAATYADEYWNSNNPNWPSFSDDCTNFVSQAMNFGGDQMTANTGSITDDHYGYMQYFSWPYPGWVHSNSWTVAGDQWQFLYNSGRAYQVASYPGSYYTSNHSGAYAGDEIYYAWYYYQNPPNYSISHMTIQVQDDYDENGHLTSVVDSHTSSRYHVNWTLFLHNANANTTEIYVTHHL